MEEIWRDIEGYEGLYQVSNLGRVKSIGRYIKHWRGGLLFREGTIMTPRLNRYGYLQLSLSKEGKCKTFTIHQLVARTFLQNPNNYTCVNHKDEVKTNNFVYVNENGSVNLEKSNLEWCEADYNCNYGTRNARIKQSQLNNPKKSKCIIQYSLSGEFISEYKSIHDAHRKTGIDRKSISNVCNHFHHYNSAGGYLWEYKEAS